MDTIIPLDYAGVGSTGKPGGAWEQLHLLSSPHGKGAQQVAADEFNCLSAYSDAQPEQCSELNFLVLDEHQQEPQFKAPSLRYGSGRGPITAESQWLTAL